MWCLRTDAEAGRVCELAGAVDGGSQNRALNYGFVGSYMANVGMWAMNGRTIWHLAEEPNVAGVGFGSV